MNVYDTVNKLAEELKNSEEYINFKNAKQAISLEPEYKIKISDFEKVRYEEQLNRLKTGEKDEANIEEMQNMYKELIEIPEIQKYFDAEFKFNVLLGDVNKIISEAVRDIV